MRLRHTQIAALLIVACALTGCTYLHGNFREVEPGAVYRSAQLSDEGLERKMERHGIRTVISFRNPDPHEAWYAEELAVCEKLEARHVSLSWSKEKLPSPESLALLLDTISTSDGPVLVHCQGGTHRSAVGAAAHLLAKGASPDEAREQFKLFFNNAPIGTLIDLYEASGESDFQRWVIDSYPAAYAAAPEHLR